MAREYTTKLVSVTNILCLITNYVARAGELAMVITSMITTRQIRAARALLGWTQRQLADRAILSINTIRLIERGAVDPRSGTLQAVRRALEDGGVEFTAGEGVRLAHPSRRGSQPQGHH